MILHIAVIDVPNSPSRVFARTDLAALQHAVADWCKQFWDADGPGRRKLSHADLTDLEVIESYFQEENGESVTFHEEEVPQERPPQPAIELLQEAVYVLEEAAPRRKSLIKAIHGLLSEAS